MVCDMKTTIMKSKFLLPVAMIAVLASCASPEQRSDTEIDTTEAVSAADSMNTDTITHTGSMSGDNGTGTDTTDTKREKATRQQGNDPNN
jgi:uncharacterized lipoprotein YajG